MDKKIYIQISIALTIVLLILYVYFFYFSSNEKKITKIDSNKDDLNIIKGTDDLISDMSYYSEDNKGNKYEIKSEFGVLSSEKSNLILMDKVTATIYLSNNEKIFISSNKANYNDENNDTSFNGSVKMIYNENIINSEYLDLSFRNQLATLYDGVNFKSKLSNLVADKVSIDFLNKKTKINMNHENTKVLVRSIIEDGNN
tara:strand:- start:5927 stop:6526 length:600 start_codon:yes stop_codon:yes gene_type:complete